MSLDEMLRERIGTLPPTVEDEPGALLERVVAGGRKRRVRARLVAGASVAAMLVLIGAATLSLTGDPSAQVDFVGPVPADADRAALPDCGRLDMRYAHAPSLSADGRVLTFIDRPLVGLAPALVGSMVVCEGSRVAVIRDPRGDAIRAKAMTLSGNGRFVVYDGWEQRGGANDPRRFRGVWVADLRGGDLDRVSRPTRIGTLDGDSTAGAISDDGRWVAFLSAARLTGERGLEGANVYLRDRALGTTTLLTAGLGARLETQDAFSQLTRPDAAISMAGDGTLVFNTLDGVFLHDPRRGTTRLVRRGLPAKISHDGRFLLQPERVVTPGSKPPPRIRVIDLSTGREELIPFGPTRPDRYVTITAAAISGSGRFVAAAVLVQREAVRQPDGGFVTRFDPNLDPAGPLIVHDRETGRATTLLAKIRAIDLSVSADGRGVVGSMGDPAGLRGLNGVVLLDTAAATATRVTWNPPWYEGRALPLTLYGAALLTLLALYQVWRLYQSPLRTEEAKQLAVLVLVVVGSAGWIWAAGGRTAGTPLIVLGVPVVVARLLRPHRWRFARARTRLRRNAA